MATEAKCLTRFGGLVGAIVGAVGKGVLDWALAMGEVRADREARQEKRLERRDDLQRQTLLDLQQAVSDLAHNTTEGDTHDQTARRDNERYSSLYWPAKLEKNKDEGLARMRLLKSRVRDSSLRKTAAAFAAACVDVSNAEADRFADRHKAEGIALFEQTQDRAGQLIREMDDL